MRSAFVLGIPTSVLLIVIVGCGGRAEAPATDGGPGIDATSPADAGADDASSPEVDGGPGLDGSTTADAAMPIDAAGEDACVPTPCAAPPDGCHYEGTTPCTCGTLVCAPSACDPGCAATEYCDLCGTTQACVTRPPPDSVFCPDVFMPVCGCDGMTYGNACELGAANIGLLHAGECGSSA